MRGLVKYSTFALTSSIVFATACRDALAPDTDRDALEPGGPTAIRSRGP